MCGEMINGHKVLLRKPEGKKHLNICKKKIPLDQYEIKGVKYLF